MLRVLGNSKQLCNGLSRRDLLRVGGLGVGGLGLAELLGLRDAAGSDATRPSSFGKAKSLILIHLYGSPSQLEWADMKPAAPVEVRGELAGIPSSVPGLHVCELLPNMAKVMDRTTVIRSMTHPHPIHGVAYAWTGTPTIDVGMELRPHDSRHWPFFPSVVDYVEHQRNPNARRAVPTNMALPFPFSSRRKGEVPRAGPYASFLGGRYNPVWTDFVGTATKGITKTLRTMTYSGNDPYMGTSPNSHFIVPSATNLQPEITLDRIDRRRSLLRQFDAARSQLERSTHAQTLGHYQQMALSLLTSNALRDALDVRKEQESVRRDYGHTLFGQACLSARRLVEAGTRVVSVFWDEFGLAGMGWDTHWNHYQRMRQELCPGFDQGWYGLISDLDRRGLLDETLVVCGSEHGRTPRLNKAKGAGRDHWSRAYTTLVAGAGVTRGNIVGATDKIGGDVADRPVSPKDLMATMYHLLGIDHRTTIQDRQGRPLPLVNGEIVEELLV